MPKGAAQHRVILLVCARHFRSLRQMHRGDGKTVALLFQGSASFASICSAVSVASPSISDNAM